jgi:hypothetical protein
MAEQRRRHIRRAAADDGTPKPGLGFLSKSLILLCLVGGVAYLFYVGILQTPSLNNYFGSAQAVSQPNTDSLSKSFGAQFLTFTHPSYGFKVKYPVGYAVVSSNLDPVALKLYALGNANVPVVIDFTITNSGLGKNDYYSLVKSIPNVDDMKAFGIWNGSARYGNNDYYIINYTQSSPYVSEDVFLTYGFINCKDYGIMIEGIVPVSSKSEQLVVNSVMESFECG